MAGDGPILGIDLGTTNSVAAILEGAEPRVIPNSEGSTKTPSVVAFFEGDKAVVGEIARRQAATNPERTVSSVKRLMGRYYSDLVESGDVERFRLQSDESDRALIGVDGVVYTPQQISALILGKLKESAEEYTNHPITQAVITVPAYFDDLQRTATLEAGRIAGLDVLRLVNEPTAAAMAYGLGRDTEELVAVYDLGGGTFDFSILDIDHKTFEVISCSGDTHLGGDDIDERVLQELKSRFEREHGFALEADAVMLRRLRDTSEKAKCELSTLTETHVSLPFFAYQNGAPLHLDCILTREELETLMEPIVRRTLEICGRALRDAGLKKKDLNKVILVGGSTRTPLVQDLVEDFFGIAPFKGVNPDEIVALGAATQGGALTGALQEVVLLDVTPHSLGVEVKDGRTSVIVKKNATVPIKETKTFTTTEDDQPFVNIHILQGESDVASDNRSLGKFRLADVPKAPAGSPRIRVTFYITADGVLEVSAGDLQSGKEQSLTISHSFLTEEERRQRERRRPPKAQRAKAKAAATAPPAAVARETPIPSTPSIEAVSPAPLPNGDSQDFDLVTSDGSLQAVDTRDRRARSVAIEIGGAVTRVPGLPPAPLLPDNISRRETQPHARGPAGPFGGNGRDLRPESTLVAPTPAGPASAWPALMAEAKALLDRGADDRPARERYASVLPVFNDYAASRPTDLEARLTLARLYLVCQRAEECCKTLADLCQGERDAWEPAFGIYAELLERFPRYQQARKERANLAERLGRLQTAIEDLEAIDTRDETKHSTAERLAELYRLRLEEAPEPQTQFKLVKLCLKLQRLDEAIAILKTLVDHPAYREQALRALGLCHWQKGEHPAAWLAFSRLPLDAGLAETLYRLACEMESADKLRQALEVFQHIEQGQRGYRDVPMRIKKLDYRVRLLRSQVDQTLPVERPLSEFDDSRFAVLEEINRGSMGVIYKAKDRILDEIVAIKILNDPLAADPVAVERFKQEARAAKRLSHPNIVRIHDMFETPKKKWLSMEYIDGDDVKRLLANHVGFSEERILQMLRQILEALDYAHGLGVVHRDIKPANIMIARNGQVKVADFGIAKILTNSDATKAGSIVVGTPLYMSPEQIEGGPVDARADLYSLGITTYELLSGAPPFTSGNLEYQHLYSAVVPLPPTVSAVLREFVGRSIAKDPVDRFQNARQAVEFLFGKM